MNKFIIFASILLISCKTEKTKIIDIEKLINKSEILLISDTVNSYKCIVTFDTTVNQLFFYRGKKKISLPKHKLFKINNTNLETNRLNRYNFETTVLDTFGNFNESNKFIVKSNYITFGLSSDLMSFYIYIIFIDDKGNLTPIYYPNYKKYSDVWGYYFDYENESFVVEERLSYNTGPYVLSVLKIKNQGLNNLGSLYNNHENFSKFNSVDSTDNFIFDRMMKESSLKIKY